MEYGVGMNELPYPSDLTAAQWALIERIRLTNRTYHFAAEFAEVGG
jgi:hypothetical protein